jgi:hypothetical protein
MWGVENRTPYKAERLWSRDKTGTHEWIVAVKATYGIGAEGRVELADEQIDPLLLPEYRGEEGQSSLAYEADLVAGKPTTDIVINATAYAPNGRPSADFLISAKVDGLAKTLRVRGHRRWTMGLGGVTQSRVEPVTEVPIVYERAYGGYDGSSPDVRRHRLDLRNPVGRGVLADPDRRSGQDLHNFEYPTGYPEKTGPAGFGAIASYWSPRRELCGTYDEQWEQDRRPLLPADWDPRSTLCGPADFRPPRHLHGGERVELINMTPEGRLSFVLPKVFLTFRTYMGGRVEEHRSRLSTVIIEPDERRLIMVWVSSLTVLSDPDYLDKTVVREKPYV